MEMPQHHRHTPREIRHGSVKVDLRILNKPALTKPTLICGLPDAGHVARIVIDELVEQLGAKLFAEIYSSSLPARVMVKEDGTVELMKHQLYFKHHADGSGNDLILYTGDVQPETPEAAYAIAEKVLDLSESLGAKSMITVAAYITGGITKTPKVYAIATTSELANELEAGDLPMIKEGEITWMNGLLIGLAKLRGLPALFFAGETLGLPHLEDTRAATAVLKVLDERMKLNLDFSKLRGRSKEAEDLLRSLEQFNEKSKGKSDSGYIR